MTKLIKPHTAPKQFQQIPVSINHLYSRKNFLKQKIPNLQLLSLYNNIQTIYHFSIINIIDSLQSTHLFSKVNEDLLALSILFGFQCSFSFNYPNLGVYSRVLLQNGVQKESRVVFAVLSSSIVVANSVAVRHGRVGVKCSIVVRHGVLIAPHAAVVGTARIRVHRAPATAPAVHYYLYFLVATQ